MGYPRFKSKKRGLGSFRLTGSIVVFPNAIQLPRLGRLRLKERGYLPTAGVKILSATVSRASGHWYVSVQVEQEQSVPENTGPVVGVDLGVKSPRDVLRWNRDCQPTPSEAPPEEDQALSSGGVVAR